MDGVCTLPLSPVRVAQRAIFRFYRASYASTVLAVIVCLSVCPSVRLSVRHKSELYKDG